MTGLVRHWLAISAVLASLLCASFNCASADDNEAQQLYEAVCTQCHGLAPIELTRNGRAGWEDTVHKMVVTGAQLSVEEMDMMIDYLYTRFGPDVSDPMRTGQLPFDSPLNGAGMTRSEDIVLPAGKGKALVEGYCVMCHDLGRVVATARELNEWEIYVKDMLRKNSINISEDDLATMLSYLDHHLGK